LEALFGVTLVVRLEALLRLVVAVVLEVLAVRVQVRLVVLEVWVMTFPLL
jgi:hypothetical protein